jgi:hypothetical protein
MTMSWTRCGRSNVNYGVHLTLQKQKWSSCSWLLLREFVKIRQEQEHQRDDAVAAGEDIPLHELPLPSIPYASFICIF